MTTLNLIQHGGLHGQNVFIEIAHWLSSPVHGFFTLVGVLAISTIAYRVLRKKA